jgi:hypothetical protein
MTRVSGMREFEYGGTSYPSLTKIAKKKITKAQYRSHANAS